MSLYSAKLRLASILAGLGIAAIFTLIVLAIARYFYGTTLSLGFISIILIFVLILDIVQYLIGPYLIGRAFRTREVTGADPQYQWLLDAVQEVCTANNQEMPRVYIAGVPFPNAFAYGSILSGRRLAVTAGLIQILDRDEVKAVIAHEVGHLRHHDVALLMAIGIIPTIIFYLGYSLIFSGGGGRNQNSGYSLLIAGALIAVSFVFNIMILGVNRLRESYADMNSVTVPNGPEKLQTALAKIVSYTPTGVRARRSQSNSSFTNMLMISDPVNGERKDYRTLLNEWKTAKVSILSSIFSNHPHPARRIQALEKIKQRSQ